VLLIDKVGRRVLTVPGQWLCTAILAVIGLWAGAPPVVVLILFPEFHAPGKRAKPPAP